MSGVVEFERGVVPVEAMRWGSGLSVSLFLFLFACAFMLTVYGVITMMSHASASAQVKPKRPV